MRRADRLFRLLQLLRNGRTWTARRLAEALEVSDRTIYRDMRDLQASGLAIDGEAGVGYLLRDFDLPPLMFTRREMEALVLGARMVQAWGGVSLATAAQDALAKIATALPGDLSAPALDMPLHAPDFHIPPEWGMRMDTLFAAVQDRAYTEIVYRRDDGEVSERRIRPLGLFFWGKAWTVLGWCGLRDDFRSFRLDRILSLAVLSEHFPEEPGKELADFMLLRRGR